MNKNIAIFDLDGTLANLEHRLHHIERPKNASINPGFGAVERYPQNWPAFYAACDKDEPIHEMIEIMLALHSVGMEIWIVSGRSDAVKIQTLDWLRRHAILPDKLLMRPNDEHTPDEELKENWIKDGTIKLDQVMCVFEDRKRVVDMWRRHGLRVCQVAEGNF
jgi:hypothetical protein